VSDRENRALEIAALRYRIIAEAAEVKRGDVTAAIFQAAAREYLDLDGKPFHVTERTLWRWLKTYRSGGFAALRPKVRSDVGQPRALKKCVLDRAAKLRRKNKKRATKTLIDILERKKVVQPGAIRRSTLDRHLEQMGVSRRQLGGLGKTTYRKVKTDAPLQLVVADFHHGPYVRVGHDDKARKALLLAFIDHFSRYILEARYYLHEDFEALRFGFRRMLLTVGLIVLLYIDNGPSFQSARFHAACSNEDLDIKVVHSKPYVSEGRGVCERFNRTVKDQFESEVRCRDELLFLDELNGYFEAWLAERYHRDIHSETGQPPFERFSQTVPPLRPAPALDRLEELLRLRQKAKVHKKWSTVQVKGTRYVVSPAMRGRRVHALYDPFDPAYVLIEHDRKIVERAVPQQAGVVPAPLEDPEPATDDTDYLELLRKDYESRTRRELEVLDLRGRDAKPELPLADLVSLVETCRGKSLVPAEHRAVTACFRKLRPIDPAAAKTALESAHRRFGAGLHIQSYLDALTQKLVRMRTKGVKRR
jgi:putative transposase